jgi:hypothetical protein
LEWVEQRRLLPVQQAHLVLVHNRFLLVVVTVVGMVVVAHLVPEVRRVHFQRAAYPVR